MHPAEFRFTLDTAAVADLRERLARTRWPRQLPGTGWSRGTDCQWLRRICEYWGESYDWSAFEARLNAWPQVMTTIDGQPLHAYHVRSPEPDAKPLLLAHGWPGSVVEFLDVIGPLSDPRGHGGDPARAFHLVVPSLPGFGHSPAPVAEGTDGHRIAEMFHGLMQSLGYPRYFVQGGDWGSAITSAMAAAHPEAVMALHLNFLTAPPLDPADPTRGLDEAEKQNLARNAGFAATETAYQQVQRSKPLSLAYGLNDSPVGLAGWVLEKFHGWGDSSRPVEERFDRDRLLDNLSLYWLTGSIASSVQLYFEHTGPGRYRPVPRVNVPTGHSRFPHEIVRTPRAWAEANYDIRYWRDVERGGHFAAMEEPGIFVGELRGFFGDYW